MQYVWLAVAFIVGVIIGGLSERSNAAERYRVAQDMDELRSRNSHPTSYIEQEFQRLLEEEWKEDDDE